MCKNRDLNIFFTEEQFQLEELLKQFLVKKNLTLAVNLESKEIGFYDLEKSLFEYNPIFLIELMHFLPKGFSKNIVKKRITYFLAQASFLELSPLRTILLDTPTPSFSVIEKHFSYLILFKEKQKSFSFRVYKTWLMIAYARFTGVIFPEDFLFPFLVIEGNDYALEWLEALTVSYSSPRSINLVEDLFSSSSEDYHKRRASSGFI